WIAGGLSSTRIDRLALENNVSCRTAAACVANYNKTHSTTSRAVSVKPGSGASCSCFSQAAQIAALVHDKKFDAAEIKVRSVLNDDPRHPWAQFVLGTILRQQSRYDDAFDAFSAAAKLKPNFPETHSQLSYLFYRDDDSDNAIAEARSALSMDPKNSEAYRYRSLGLYSERHNAAA